MITHGSVCSGIEAASAAWADLGWKPSWFSEVDQFPSEVLRAHYPETQNLGDMTLIASKVLSGDVIAPDILVGGTPCQAFSVAGMRGGLSDERGSLTLKYVELADAVDSIRSDRGEQECVIVWENVPGVLSSKDNAFGCFLGALAGEDCELQPAGKRWPNAGCAYGPQRAIAWRILDAQYFGLAQRRKRVFLVASARDGFDPAKVLFEFDGVRRDSPPSRNKGQDPTHRTKEGIRAAGSHGTQDPIVSAENAHAVAIHENQRSEVRETDVFGVLSTGGGKAGQGRPVVRIESSVRRLTPVESERLMGFPENYTQIEWRGNPASECPDGHRYKALGNSMAVPVMRWIGSRISLQI